MEKRENSLTTDQKLLSKEEKLEPFSKSEILMIKDHHPLEECKEVIGGTAVQNSSTLKPDPYSSQKTKKTIDNIPTKTEFNILIRDMQLGKCAGKLKARVSYKSPIYDNKFVIDVSDEERYECRMLFEEDPCFLYYELIKEGKIYIIENLLVKKSFVGSVKQFFLMATNSTKIMECVDDAQSIPELKLQRCITVREINEISDTSKAFNVIVKVFRQSDPQKRMIKGEQHIVKDVWLIDSEEKKIKYTLWDDMITKFCFDDGEIILCRSVKLASNSEVRLVSTGDTAFITKGADLRKL